MKLATLRDGTKDGRLVVVSWDLSRALDASRVIGSLREAMERWTEVEADLLTLSDEVNGPRGQTFEFKTAEALAPLPRAWQWLAPGSSDAGRAGGRLARGARTPTPGGRLERSAIWGG